MSLFVFLCCFVLCRLNLDVAALLLPFNKSNDSISTVWRVSGWLHDVGMSQVSHFDFLCYFVIDTLDLDLYRYDLDPTMLPSPSNEPNDPVRRFWIVCGSLHHASALQVGLSAVLCLVDFCRYDFDSSMSMARPNGSIHEATLDNLGC